VRCKVFSVEIYPIFGLTKFEMPWSRFDHCVIAWGGVIAQAIVAVPIVVYVSVFGYTRFEPANAVLALLGFFSLGVAVFNLLPIRRLDGSTAWGIVPEAIKRFRMRRRVTTIAVLNLYKSAD
jgi:Zn-dependent protease